MHGDDGVAAASGWWAFAFTSGQSVSCAPVCVRLRVHLIRHCNKACTTDVYLHHECAHVGLSVHAPVRYRRRESVCSVNNPALHLLFIYIIHVGDSVQYRELNVSSFIYVLTELIWYLATQLVQSVVVSTTLAPMQRQVLSLALYCER